jgi:hypothetical protein
MMDEMLPETECPGRAVIVLDVSLETSESGLGMNSSVSENPTRALGMALTGEGVLFFGLSGTGIVLSTDSGLSGLLRMGSDSTGFRVFSCDRAKDGDSRWPNSAGLVGALLPLGMVFAFVGWRIRDRSWFEIAADRR